MTGREDSTVPSTQLATLQWQFQLTWRLAQHHLPALTDAACLWEPAPGSWTVRPSTDGQWHADWTTPEADPAPPVTIGWLTWHILWWWPGLLAVMHQETPTAPEEVIWPGSAGDAVERISALAGQWTALLAQLTDDDLERPIVYLWPDPRPLRIAVAWVNSELMKNIAEIGYIRHMFVATHGVR